MMSAEIIAPPLPAIDREQHRKELLHSADAAIEQIKLGDYLGAAMTFTWLARHLHRLQRLADAETAVGPPRP
jgi:hypothetical protein